MHLGGWERGHEALGFLHELGVRDVDRPCGARSGGERRRIALAQLLVASPDIAILDEPTNHLDADTAEWLEEYLAQDYSGALVLVTHDRYFLDAIAQRIVELERGRLTSYAGGYADYLEKKAELMAHEERVEQNRQNILRREREWLSRGPKARTTKQKARIQRAHALEAQSAGDRGASGRGVAGGARRRRGRARRSSSSAALQVAGGDGAPPLNAPFDLILDGRRPHRHRRARTASGRRRSCARSSPPSKRRARASARRRAARVVAGEIVVGKNTRVAYLDQARAKLDDDEVDLRRRARRGRERPSSTSASRGAKRSTCAATWSSSSSTDRSSGRRSARSRAASARASRWRRCCAKARTCSSSTSRRTISTCRRWRRSRRCSTGTRGSVLVVTHDRAFLDRVATAILAFEGGSRDGPATVTRYAGGYSDYVAQRNRKPEPARDANRRTEPPPSRFPHGAASAKPSAPPPPGLTFAEKKELAAIVADIDRAEQAVSAVEEKLADPSLYAGRGPDAAKLQAELAAARAEAARLVSRWETLETKKGG